MHPSKMKHYRKKTKYDSQDGRTYDSRCGLKGMKHTNITHLQSAISCPECLLIMMTEYENKIAILEDRYMELFPNRPVGEKFQ